MTFFRGFLGIPGGSRAVSWEYKRTFLENIHSPGDPSKSGNSVGISRVLGSFRCFMGFLIPTGGFKKVLEGFWGVQEAFLNILRGSMKVFRVVLERFRGFQAVNKRSRRCFVESQGVSRFFISVSGTFQGASEGSGCIQEVYSGVLWEFLDIQCISGVSNSFKKLQEVLCRFKGFQGVPRSFKRFFIGVSGCLMGTLGVFKSVPGILREFLMIQSVLGASGGFKRLQRAPWRFKKSQGISVSLCGFEEVFRSGPGAPWILLKRHSKLPWDGFESPKTSKDPPYIFNIRMLSPWHKKRF